MRKALFNGFVDPLCLASLYSKVLTVSPYYADELSDQKHEDHSGGFGAFCYKNRIEISGITNGIDIDRFSLIGVKGFPSGIIKKAARLEVFPHLKKESSLKVWGEIDLSQDKPIFLFQNRITGQKGIDRFIRAFEAYVKTNSDAYFIVMGEGESIYEEQLKKLALSYNGSFCYVQGYYEKLALKLFLASDFFVLSSLWEPCGLTDFEAQLVGTIPIVYKTGGLQKVIHGETGFVYSDPDILAALFQKCTKLYINKDPLLESIKNIAYKKILESYTWDMVVAQKYIPMFIDE